METKSYNTTILTPAEGHYLTQAGDVDISERVVATAIALGRHDSPDNYREITPAEADALCAAIADHNRQQQPPEE